jgi:hypothetical protein
MHIIKTLSGLLSGIVLIMASGSSGFAQKFEGGILAGLSASQVAGDNYSGYNKAGVFVGSYVALVLSDRLNLRLELEYIQKGSRKNPVPDKGDYDSYLMLRFHFGRKLVAEAGPAVSFLLHSSEKFNQEDVYYHPFAKQNLSMIAGISYPVTSRISAGLRTNNSLFSIRKDTFTGNVWRFWGYGQFNDALVFTLGYRL